MYVGYNNSKESGERVMQCFTHPPEAKECADWYSLMAVNVEILQSCAKDCRVRDQKMWLEERDWMGTLEE